MRLFVALRLPSEHFAKPVVAFCGESDVFKSSVIDANIARHHPALKNVISYLILSGTLPEKIKRKISALPTGEQDREADFRLYWCEIDTDLPVDHWYAQIHVEVVIPKEEFSKFAASIRHKSGAAYVVACETYAQSLRVNGSDLALCAAPPAESHKRYTGQARSF